MTVESSLPIQPSATRALVISIEEYGDNAIPRLSGCAAHALEFVRWLGRRGVPKSQIIFRTTIIDSEKERERTGVQAVIDEGGKDLPIGFNVLNQALASLRDSSGNDLLILFWTGHGFSFKSREEAVFRNRQLLFADYRESDKQTVDFNALVSHLLTRPEYPSRQVHIVDACATMFPSLIETEAEIVTSGLARHAHFGNGARLAYVFDTIFSCGELAQTRQDTFFPQLMMTLQDVWPNDWSIPFQALFKRVQAQDQTPFVVHVSSPQFEGATFPDRLLKRYSQGRLPPPTNPKLFVGRNNWIKYLDECWFGRDATIVQFVASGGVGKSTVVWNWLKQLKDTHSYRECNQVFDWSFYSQGQHEYQTDGSKFLNEALKHFAYLLPRLSTDVLANASAEDKADALATAFLICGGVILLDGLEPLQYPESQGGQLYDKGLVRFFNRLIAAPVLKDADRSRLLLVTTRWEIGDLSDLERPGGGIRKVPLDNFSRESGAQLLQGFRFKSDPTRRLVYGSDLEIDQISPAAQQEFEEASDEFGGHALALTVLATFLIQFHNGRIEERKVIESISTETHPSDGPLSERSDPYKHARRVIRSYDRILAKDPSSRACRQILFQLGLFDRPAPIDLLGALRIDPPIRHVTQDVDEIAFGEGLRRLRYLRLISDHSDDATTISAHPLLREHYGRQLRKYHPEAWQAAHYRLFESLDGPRCPLNLEQMEPLFQKVVHGCKAGRYREAFSVLEDRVLGKDEYAAFVLGAFTQLVSVLSHFFKPGNSYVPIRLRGQKTSLTLTFDEQILVLRYMAKYLTPTKGYAATETKHCYRQGIKYAIQYKKPNDEFYFQFGYWRVLQAKGDIKGNGNRLSSCKQADLLIDQANKLRDQELMYMALTASTVAYVSHGEFRRTLNHVNQTRVERDPDLMRETAQRFLDEPVITTQAFGSIAYWHVGEIGMAANEARDAVKRAKELDHTHTRVVTLYATSFFHLMRRAYDEALHTALEILSLTQGHGYYFWRCGGYTVQGLAEAHVGFKNEDTDAVIVGCGKYRRGIDRWRMTGARVHVQFWSCVYSDLLLNRYRREGKQEFLSEAEKLLRESSKDAQERGELWWSAESFRLQGEVYREQSVLVVNSRARAVKEAERLIQCAVRLAQMQNSKMLYLRSVASLAELLDGEHRLVEARGELEKVAGQFDGAVEDADLRRVRRFLNIIGLAG
jgi:hypothetical protein